MTHSTSHRHPGDTPLLANVKHQTRCFLSDEDGVSAIEYALLASLIAIVALAGISALGLQLGMTWTHVATEVGKVT